MKNEKVLINVYLLSDININNLVKDIETVLKERCRKNLTIEFNIVDNFQINEILKKDKLNKCTVLITNKLDFSNNWEEKFGKSILLTNKPCRNKLCLLYNYDKKNIEISLRKFLHI